MSIFTEYCIDNVETDISGITYSYATHVLPIATPIIDYTLDAVVTYKAF